jgi:hypothetical protein
LYFFKSLLVIWNYITHKVRCCRFVMFLCKFCLCTLLCGFCLCFFWVWLIVDLLVWRWGTILKKFILFDLCVWITIIVVGIKMVAHDKGYIICKGWWLNFQQTFCNIIFGGYLCPLAPCETLRKVVFGPCDVKSLLVCNQWHRVVCWHEKNVFEGCISHLT